VTFSTKKITIVCMAMMAYAVAQTPPAAAPADTRKFKNDQEQALAIAANTEKDPAARLEKLDKWKNDFPESDYADARTGLYFSTYGDLKRFHDQILAAQELRKKVPESLGLLRGILVAFSQITSPTPEDRAAATDAATYIVKNADQVFAPDKAKENGMSAADWEKAKPAMVAYAKTQVDKIVTDQGMDAVIAALKADPTRVTLNVWLGAYILKQAQAGHPEKQGDAIFNYARAAAYTGPGCLDPKDRAGMKTFVDKAYKTFHGSLEGEDKLLAAAAAQPLPDGYVIESTVDIAKKGAAAEDAARAANPMLAQWRDLKTILTGDGGQAKFDADIKDSALPPFKGKIISMTPAMKPKSVVVAVEKDGVADCTLTFEAPLAGNMQPGEEIGFEGIAKSFTKDPFMLTVTVEKDKLTGWTGKNAPAVKKAAPKKSL